MILIVQAVLVALYFIFGDNAFLWTAAGLGLLTIAIPRFGKVVDHLTEGLGQAVSWVGTVVSLGVFTLLLLPMVATRKWITM